MGQGGRTAHVKNDVIMAVTKDAEPAGKRRDSRTTSGSTLDCEGVAVLLNIRF